MRERSARNRQLAKERARIERKMSGRREAGSAFIVCEGACTEPYYLSALLRHLGINPASVEIVAGTSNSNAVAIMNRARERFEQAPRDRMFVLIDGDQNDLQRALQVCQVPLQRANKKRGIPEVCIEPVISTPCFEVWLLLHFRYSDRPFVDCLQVLGELKVDLPQYEKADPSSFERVGAAAGLQRAMQNASRLREALRRSSASSPATDMDRLVGALRGMLP